MKIGIDGRSHTTRAKRLICAGKAEPASGSKLSMPLQTENILFIRWIA
ncbi:hypothetical protein IWQ49_002664 [Labrenzia sp. EL_126]|nr:hypothetical protein [Labrenzia sp. EL_126]